MSRIALDGLKEVDNLRAKILRAVVGVPKEVQATNGRWAGRLRASLIEHSSGRPGPQEVTGEYNRNYVVVTSEDGMTVNASNPSPQTDRLEFGYVATDSLGRTYHQPPYPHWRPTFEQVAPLYREDILQAFPRVWR